MRLTLRGARLVDAEIDVPRGDITLEDGRSSRSGRRRKPARAHHGRSWADRHARISSTFIRTAAAATTCTPTRPKRSTRMRRWAPHTGVTAFLVGIVGTPGDLPEPQIRAAAAAIEEWHAGAEAEPLGIHLEGPYISVERRGAHLPSWLRTPDPVETERILSLANGHLRLVTLAPELPGAHDMITRLVEEGITVSIGHTDASYEQALEAIALGATHATHCCNAMRPLLHRDPGPLGAIALSPAVAGELIADGVHVHPAMAQVLIKLLGSDRTILITDALAGAGSDNGAFEFAGQRARVVGGAARLSDGTLTGSVLTMDQALRNVCRAPRYLALRRLSHALAQPCPRRPCERTQRDARAWLSRPISCCSTRSHALRHLLPGCASLCLRRVGDAPLAGGRGSRDAPARAIVRR